MSDLPTIDDAKETVSKARGLVPWLEDPHQCECGEYCEATTEYVGEQAMYVDVWVCPNDDCGARYYRDRE